MMAKMWSTFALLFMTQAPPKVPDSALVSTMGQHVVVTLPYTLNGGPDSVINIISGSLSNTHRHPATGMYATQDTFMQVRSGPGTMYAGQVCAQAKKGNNVSASVCAPYSWTEPTPPPQPPAPPSIGTPTVDTTAGGGTPPPLPGGDVLFVDTFVDGKKSGYQNGVGWGMVQIGANGSRDSAFVASDASTLSGYSYLLRFGGNASTSDDAWVEPRFVLPKLTEVFICMEYGVPANYAHRDVAPDNNKLLRLWDSAYTPSVIHIGMSTLPQSATSGKSVMIVEYKKDDGSGTGNYGTGPWNMAFVAGDIDTVGFYAKVPSAPGADDGVITVIWNGTQVYHRTDLPMSSPNTAGWNAFSNGYVLGWSNSGFAQTTDIRLRRLLVARKIVPC